MPNSEFRQIKLEELVGSVSNLHEQGCRLIQICCSKAGEGYEMDYSFDREYAFIDLKIQVTHDVEIESISRIFAPAFLYENEIEALFGMKINHKSVDFHGKLYTMAQQTPFADAQKGD